MTVEEGFSLDPLLDAVANEAGELKMVDPETVVDT